MKHGCPRQQQSWNIAKISKSYILTPPHSQGHVMSVKCEEPIDEVIVQVWLLYHNPNFNIALCKWDGITDRQTHKRTDRQTDDPITRCPRQTFQAGGIKTRPFAKIWTNTLSLLPHTLLINSRCSRYVFSVSNNSCVIFFLRLSRLASAWIFSDSKSPLLQWDNSANSSSAISLNTGKGG